MLQSQSAVLCRTVWGRMFCTPMTQSGATRGGVEPPCHRQSESERKRGKGDGLFRSTSSIFIRFPHATVIVPCVVFHRGEMSWIPWHTQDENTTTQCGKRCDLHGFDFLVVHSHAFFLGLQGFDLEWEQPRNCSKQCIIDNYFGK